MSAEEIVVSVFAGAGGGTLASLITPWAQWAVDKRRRRMVERAKAVAGARQLVADKQDYDRDRILIDPRYLAIRGHLDPKVEAKLREQSLVAQRDSYGTAGNYYLGLIRDEADRLEKEWELK